MDILSRKFYLMGFPGLGESEAGLSKSFLKGNEPGLSINMSRPALPVVSRLETFEDFLVYTDSTSPPFTSDSICVKTCAAQSMCGVQDVTLASAMTYEIVQIQPFKICL